MKLNNSKNTSNICGRCSHFYPLCIVNLETNQLEGHDKYNGFCSEDEGKKQVSAYQKACGDFNYLNDNERKNRSESIREELEYYSKPL